MWENPIWWSGEWAKSTSAAGDGQNRMQVAGDVRLQHNLLYYWATHAEYFQHFCLYAVSYWSVSFENCFSLLYLIIVYGCTSRKCTIEHPLQVTSSLKLEVCFSFGKMYFIWSWICQANLKGKFLKFPRLK